ncbi:MAG TPA: hypothetical protein VK835_08265 [Bacteroidia bacterium]|jgi:hypothetical protein|nr:hypothetical protein [Bacteroidia bacterium]
MVKKIIILTLLITILSCSNKSKENKEVLESNLSNTTDSISKLLLKLFPSHSVQVEIIGNKLNVTYFDSLNVGGLDSYQHLIVEQIVSYSDSLIKSIGTMEIDFKVFNTYKERGKYLLINEDIKTIIRNHKNNPKLLAYKHYLTNTMNGKECHDLLSALYGIAKAGEDNTLKTDFYNFALMYAEATQKNNAKKKDYYKSVMDELYDGFSDPKIKIANHVEPQHIKDLMKILE